MSDFNCIVALLMTTISIESKNPKIQNVSIEKICGTKLWFTSQKTKFINLDRPRVKCSN